MSSGPVDVDPFDLPESLGTGAVTWSATDGIGARHLVRGLLRPEAGAPVACDLLAVDEAYPAPVADDAVRHSAHQAWRHGQVHLVAYDGRLTLLAPGTRFTADGVLDLLTRLAKALGAEPGDFAVHLRLADGP